MITLVHEDSVPPAPSVRSRGQVLADVMAAPAARLPLISAIARLGLRGAGLGLSGTLRDFRGSIDHADCLIENFGELLAPIL